MAADSTTGGRLSFNAYQNPTNQSQSRVQITGGQSTAAANGPIYIKDANYAYLGPGGANGKQDVLVPVTQAQNSYFFLDSKAKQVLNSKMDAWYGKGAWKPSWIPNFYKKAAQGSAYAYANSGQKLTPLDMFDAVLSSEGGTSAQAGGKSGGGGGGVAGPTTSIQVTKSVNLTDPASARKMVNDALTNYLGRAATPEEQATFQRALSGQEQANPSVSTQKSTTRRSGSTSVTTGEVMSEGGFNPSTFAEEWAAGQQGSGEFQAATTYLNTFIDALKARV